MFYSSKELRGIASHVEVSADQKMWGQTELLSPLRHPLCQVGIGMPQRRSSVSRLSRRAKLTSTNVLCGGRGSGERNSVPGAPKANSNAAIYIDCDGTNIVQVRKPAPVSEYRSSTLSDQPLLGLNECVGLRNGDFKQIGDGLRRCQGKPIRMRH